MYKFRLMCTFLLIILMSRVFVLHAQQSDFDEQAFLSSLENGYYVLKNKPITNFIALVRSAKIDTFSRRNWGKVNISPLQLIWKKPTDVFISELSWPFDMDSSQAKLYREIIEALKIQIKGIVLDLQRFYLNGFASIIAANDYILKHSKDAIQITIRSGDEQQTKVKYLFGLNGLCLLVKIEYPLMNKMMHIYPEFELFNGKWLCRNWLVQTSIKGEVVSAFKVIVDYQAIDGVLLPTLFTLEVQRADEKNTIYYEKIRLTEHKTNQKIVIKER